MVIAAILSLALTGPTGAQTPAPPPTIGGAWTLNKELSDAPPRGDREGDEGRARGDGGRRGGYGGGGGRGGFGGRGMGGGGMGNAQPMNPEDSARKRDAMR